MVKRKPKDETLDARRSKFTELQKQIKSSKIELRPVNDLLPYAMNSRVHADWQIAQIASSIKEFGWTNPVLIKSDGTIIAGHARIMAAMKLEIETVPCIVLDHLTDAQMRAYVIADNQLALNASWDDEMLSSELDYLASAEFDVKLLGLDLDKLSSAFIPDLPDEGDDTGFSETDFGLRVTLDSEEKQQELFQELRDRGFRVKV